MLEESLRHCLKHGRLNVLVWWRFGASRVCNLYRVKGIFYNISNFGNILTIFSMNFEFIVSFSGKGVGLFHHRGNLPTKLHSPEEHRSGQNKQIHL